MSEPFTPRLLRRPWCRGLLFALTSAVLAMIFLFSAQEGDISAGLSDGPARWLIAVFVPDFDSLAPDTRAGIYTAAQLVVRKAAHFSEFALLALLVTLLLESYSRPRAWLSGWLLATVWACADEWHQTFVAQRSGTPWDVAVDSLGALAGAALATLLVLAACRRRWRASLRNTRFNDIM